MIDLNSVLKKLLPHLGIGKEYAKEDLIKILKKEKICQTNNRIVFLIAKALLLKGFIPKKAAQSEKGLITINSIKRL